MTLKDILALQDRWARGRWHNHTGRRAPSLEHNLILPMRREVHDQFARGSGSELGREGKPGKMISLRSSSALAYNFFAPWIHRDLGALARALGTTLADSTITFERQFRHGLASIPPNLDVVLDGNQPRPLAIESKFTEPYGPKGPQRPLDNKYFAGGRRRWSELRLPKCQALAANLGTKVRFSRLGVGQLLKHVLGLAHETEQPPRLLCLWFDSCDHEAAEHRAELARFEEVIDDSITFSAVTYQEAFRRIPRTAEPVTGYHDYMAARYFAA